MKWARRVLVADDDAWVRTMIADVLEYAGYDVVTAHNGAEALAVMRATRPDCVVLDLIMPVLDGWGFLEACRQEEVCAKTPVLVMSACKRLAEALPAELRVDHVLAKPFELEALLQAVQQLVT